MKIVKKNQLKIVIFTAVKNRFIFHGRVFLLELNVISSRERYMLSIGIVSLISV